MNFYKDTYCSYCGAVFTMATWPRDCTICGNTTWQNPLPVAVVAIRVKDASSGYDKGYVLIKRSIEPHAGEWAFPGGYLELNETWQQGAAREVLEETGIIVTAGQIQLHSVVTSPQSSNLVLFCQATIWSNEVKFVPNDEVSEIVITNVRVKLAFPSHTELLNKVLTYTHAHT